MSVNSKTLKFIPSIEGLRAVAVILVMVFHAFQDLLPGGFVGVDVFYVLSGFLITNILWTGMRAKKPLRLSEFYARRVRRIVPAAAVVLITTAIVSFILPKSVYRAFGFDILAATWNVGNIRSSITQAQYFQEAGLPSPVLHFWSLAVEEQFYIVWPLLILATLWITRRMQLNVKASTNVLTSVLGVVFTGSLLTSIITSQFASLDAFYLLPSRAWELAAGALVAVQWSTVSQCAGRLGAWGSWVGLGAVVASGVAAPTLTLVSGTTPLLAVFGTVLLVASSSQTNRVNGALSVRPLRAMGRWSYSAYLWHWPLLVFGGALFAGVVPAPVAKLTLLVLAVGLAAVTYRFVEVPARTRALFTGSRENTFLMGGLLNMAVTLAAVGLVITGPASTIVPLSTASGSATGEWDTTPVPRDAAANPIYNSQYEDSRPIPLRASSAEIEAQIAAAVKTDTVPDNLVPSLGKVLDEYQNTIQKYHCNNDWTQTYWPDCEFGDLSSSKTVWLLGDSRAAQWFPAAHMFAVKHHLKLIVHTKNACPTINTMLTLHLANDPDPAAKPYKACLTWNRKVISELKSLSQKPEMILVSNAGWDTTDYQEPYARTLATYKSLAKQVVVIEDTPHTGHDMDVCLSTHKTSATQCIVSWKDALPSWEHDHARTAASTAGVGFVETSQWLCNRSAGCPGMADGVNLYRDGEHISSGAARWLFPVLDAELTKYLPSWW